MAKTSRRFISGFLRLAQRGSLYSLGVLLLFVIAAGIFVYQVSPLRNPSFQPNSGNGGSLLPGLQGLGDGFWLQGATLLAALLATNLVIVFWQWSRHSQIHLIASWSRSTHPVARLLVFIFWMGVGAVLFSGSWLVFVIHLLNQWLID